MSSIDRSQSYPVALLVRGGSYPVELVKMHVRWERIVLFYVHTSSCSIAHLVLCPPIYVIICYFLYFDYHIIL